MVLGSEGLPWVESLPGVEAELLWLETDGLRAEATSGFGLHLITDEAAPHAASYE